MDLLNLIKGFNNEALKEAVIDLYCQFGLLDKQGNWSDPLFDQHQSSLLPSNIKEELSQMLKRTQEGINDNHYLIQFIESIPPGQLEDEFSSLSHDNTLYYSAFFFVLEKSNLFMTIDPNYTQFMLRFLRKQRAKNNFYRLSNILAIIKLHSVELPVILFSRRWHSKRPLNPSFGKLILSINIFEAGVVDFFKGYWDNAKATLPLMRFSPNHKKGAPARYSDCGNFLEMISPKQKLWNDLYQVWNMAFVTQFIQAPLLLIKLFIPSVVAYKDNPSQYMHVRITALNLALNYLDLCLQNPMTKVDLSSLTPLHSKWTKQWGRINRTCAEHYLQEVCHMSKL